MKILIITIAVLACAGCNDPLMAAAAWSRTNMVKAIIGEAEGEAQEGMDTIACAIKNRGTLHGVYGLYSKRVEERLYSRETWNKALLALWMAEDPQYCDQLIHGAQYWEGSKFKTPYWAKHMTLTAVIGNQRFYRKD